MLCLLIRDVMDDNVASLEVNALEVFERREHEPGGASANTDEELSNDGAVCLHGGFL